MVELVTLQPLSQSIIPSKILIGNYSGLQKGDWLLENTQIQPGVHVARSVYAGSQSDSGVEIVNLNNRPIDLRGNQVLGELHLVEVASAPSKAAGKESGDWGSQWGR